MATSTLPPPRSLAQSVRARRGRRVLLALLVGFVLLGAVGTFGTRTAHRSATAGGYELTVTYPSVSRPGHAIRYQVEVRRPGGLGTEPLRLALSSDYFHLFDENGFSPAADVESADGEWDLFEFTPPPGERFVLTVDTRVEPAVQRGRRGEAAVLDALGERVVSVGYRTRIWP